MAVTMVARSVLSGMSFSLSRLEARVYTATMPTGQRYATGVAAVIAATGPTAVALDAPRWWVAAAVICLVWVLAYSCALISGAIVPTGQCGPTRVPLLPHEVGPRSWPTKKSFRPFWPTVPPDPRYRTSIQITQRSAPKSGSALLCVLIERVCFTDQWDKWDKRSFIALDTVNSAVPNLGAAVGPQWDKRSFKRGSWRTKKGSSDGR